MERHLRFQVSVFGNFKDIDFSQDGMSKLYQIYLKENLMPSVMREFNVLSQDVKNRPNFVANDNSISIAIASDRIDVVSDLSAGEKMLSKDDFIFAAKKYLQIFFDVFVINASRMSFISEGIVKIIENPNEEKVERKYLNIQHMYNGDKVFEWSSNSVSMEEWDINGEQEKVNLNITIAQRRMNAVKNDKPILINTLVLTQDINTVAENTASRLNILELSAFLDKASSKSDEICNVTKGI